MGSNLGKLSLAERLELTEGNDNADEVMEQAGGSREMTFTIKKSRSDQKAKKEADHVEKEERTEDQPGKLTKTLKKPKYL